MGEDSGGGKMGGGTTYLLASDVSFSVECLFIWIFWRCFIRTVFQAPFPFMKFSSLLQLIITNKKGSLEIFRVIPLSAALNPNE